MSKEELMQALKEKDEVAQVRRAASHLRSRHRQRRTYSFIPWPTL